MMTIVFSIIAGIFSFFSSKIKWILGLAALVSLLSGLGYVAYLKYQLANTADTITNLATERDVATNAAKQNAAAVAKIMAHDLAIQNLASEEQIKLNRLQEILRNAEVEIAKASAKDNGPLAPVLRGALKQLRAMDAAVSGTTNAGSGG